jgi:hypothetical protein
MGGNTTSLHRAILPSASGRPACPTSATSPRPYDVAATPASRKFYRPMMPMTPYQAINYMGHQLGPPPLQFKPPSPAVVPPAPPPTPPAGMMMPNYNPYAQPLNF